MNVGIQEAIFVLISILVVAVTTRRRAEGKASPWPNRAWLWGVPGILAFAAVTSPADPLSSLLFAVPASTIYVTALLRLERRLTPISN